jgi:cation transport ATPase
MSRDSMDNMVREPILNEAAENVLERRMPMEISMTIVILAALAIGQFFTALVIVLFVLIAEVLEGLTAQRGRTAIRESWNLLPNKVTVRRMRLIRPESMPSAEITCYKPTSRE